MTAEKLIERLGKFPPKAQVLLNEKNGYPCLFVLAVEGDDSKVWLECEADCDLHSELLHRFQAARELELDETDFYSDLLETGIDVDTVRKYMGEECATHMEIYCEDHGLI